MGFYLHHCWFYPGGCENLLELRQADVRQADGLAPTRLYQTLHGFPGIQQRYGLIINNLAAFIPGVLLVSGFEGKWSMNGNIGRHIRAGVS